MERIYLNAGDKIKLVRNLDSREFEEFEIQSIIGVGASSVCYFAKLGEKSGHLKEFYPIFDSFNEKNNFNCLERTETNQLVTSNEIFVESFKKMCTDYLSSFKVLDEARTQEGGLLLNNFIPVQEIYFGYSESGTASVYIFSPDDKHGLTFSEYVEDVRKNFEHQPVKKFFNVLRTVLTLTDCVKVFHSLGIIHCDLKPSNFLVTYDSDGEINSANISLFDLNSIYNLKSEFPCYSKGTHGFVAPELEQGRVSNRVDLYSLGCILFNAVIIAKEAESTYKAQYFDIIPQLINHSELINASNVNSNLQVESLLSRILKKCLAHSPLERYNNCEEFIFDLKQLILLLVPELSVDALKDIHKKIIIVDDENIGISDPTIILQDLLYKTPLFDWYNNTENVLNIITIGSGTFAQKFIDQALQAAQVPFIDSEQNICERKILIKAFSNNPEYDKELYCSKRPALAEFVNLNGSLNKFEKDIYGQLDFLEVPKINANIKGFSVFDMEVNTEIIDQIVSDAESRIDYIFIALGDDDLNKKIADAFVDATQSLEMSTKINYVVHDNIEQPSTTSIAQPVFISKKITSETISPMLEQRAWNCHLSWLGTLCTDLRKEFEHYSQRYNHESSLAFALSIRYKLASLRIDDEKPDAAYKFAEKITDSELLKVFNYYEHRRWVLSMVCDGWQKPKRLWDCLNSIRQNEKPQDLEKFLHHCILRSDKESALPNSPEKWGSAKNLDDLDKMSVDLNQLLRREAQRFRNSDPLNIGDLRIIRDEVSNCSREIQLAYKKFEFYLKLILSGNKNHSKNFKAYFEEFTDTIKNSPIYTTTIVPEKLANLRKDFAVVSAGNLYTDYKLYDSILVKNIPFIMTFQTPNIAIAFDDGWLHGGKNLEVFRNVAATTVLNPKQITFLYCFSGNSPRVAFMQEKFTAVLSFLKERKSWANISLCIAIINTKSTESQNSFVQRIEKYFNEISDIKIKIQLCENHQTAMDYFFQNLKENNTTLYDGSTDLFHSHYWNSIFTERIISNFPYFEFNAVNKKFTITKNCEHLNFISDNSFIYVKDLFSLRKVQVNTYNNFADYTGEFFNDLWEIYKNQDSNNIDEDRYFRSIEDFAQLARILQSYEQNSESLHFNISINLPNGEIKEFIYHLANHSKFCVEKILKILVKYNLIEENFEINLGRDLVVKLNAKSSIQEFLTGLFHNLNSVTDPDFITVKEESDNSITIYLRDLHVENLNLQNRGHIFWILRRLNEKGLITNFQNQNHNDIVSFYYANNSIKKLLTTTGLILEVHIYFEAIKLSFFNDVVANFYYSWYNSSVKNEIDCILTKGFNSIIIEAKAGRAGNLQQEAFQKFDSIVDDFGIASLKVFVCNTKLSDIQLERAEKMGIIVINKVADILDIGETLKKIIAGRFKN